MSSQKQMFNTENVTQLKGRNKNTLTERIILSPKWVKRVESTLIKAKQSEAKLKARNMQLRDDIANAVLYPQSPLYASCKKNVLFLDYATIYYFYF